MTSSPECWAAFGALLAVQYSEPARMAYHQLLVDAYAVQHPGGDHAGRRLRMGRSAWDAWHNHHDVVEGWLLESGLRQPT